MSSWRRNRALFDSLRQRRETEKRSLRSLRSRNGISQISVASHADVLRGSSRVRRIPALRTSAWETKISGDSLSRVTQGKQRNAIVVTQTISLARIVLSIGEAYSWNK